jgi:hypothetical protein
MTSIAAGSAVARGHSARHVAPTVLSLFFVFFVFFVVQSFLALEA